ncbi:NCS2 family permease [Spirochaetota bacterium]
MIREYFKLKELGTDIRHEIIGGLTTFITMAYIIIVNPKILEAAGIPFGPSMVATILTAFFGTLCMGLYARRPFAIAPYMGENAFIAFTVVKVLGYSWQTAIGAVFIGGVLFTFLTIFNIREWLVRSIPQSLKIGFAVGIGLFLAFIGLNETGIVKLGVPGAPVHVGNFKDPTVILAIIGFIIICFFMIRKIRGSIIISILSITIVSILMKKTPVPDNLVSLPPSLAPTFLQLDILGALKWGFFSVILTIFVMDLVDTMGTLIGISYKAGLLDKDGHLPDIKKPMLCDALATVVGALLGTTTSGTFIESATGIEAGGRSGLSAVVTALMFLLALFFTPLFQIIPPWAYGPALIVVGMMMISTVSKLQMDDLTETIPVFCVITLMSFTYNIGIGMTASFVIYPVMKVLSGRIKEVPAGLWLLGAISIVFYVFFPY